MGLTILSTCSVQNVERSSEQAGHTAVGGRPWWRPAGGAVQAAKLRAVGGIGVRGASHDSGAADGSADPLSELLSSDRRYVAALARSLHQLLTDPDTDSTPPAALAARLAASLAHNMEAVGSLPAGVDGSAEAGRGQSEEELADPSLPRYWEHRMEKAAAQAAAAAGAAAAPAPPPSSADSESPLLTDSDVESALLAELGGHGISLRDGRTVDGRYSQQTCYAGGDESEVCVYDGIVCTDGSSPVLVTSDPPVNTMPEAVRGPPREGDSKPTQLQTAAGASEPLGVPDPHSDCQDYRYGEASAWRYSSCRYDRSGDRPYTEALAEAMRLPHVAAAVHDARYPSIDHPLDLTNRYLGPLNRRDVLVRPLGREDVWPAAEEGWAGVEAAAAAAGAPAAHPGAPGVRFLARNVPSSSGRVTVDWLPADQSLWLVPSATQVNVNPFFWMASGVAPLFGAQRANASLCGTGGHSLPCLDPHEAPIDARAVMDSRRTLAEQAAGQGSARASDGRARSWGAHPLDGWMHAPARGWLYAGQSRTSWRSSTLSDTGHDSRSSVSANTVRWVVGPQWGPLPSQDLVLFLGWGGVQTDSRAKLGSWFEGTLALGAQRHSQVFFNDLRSAYNATHLLCARRGAVTGSKPRIFSSHADAWMWRQYAYMATGLTAKGVLTQSIYPPRRITVIERKGQTGRGLFNLPEVMELVRATGLPVEVVPRMDYLTFAQQVELMSGTGILIAPHGAALMNSMFLPAHAVVIELFPPLLKNGVFERLAGTMGLLYYSVHARTVLPPNMTHMMGPAFMASPEFAKECISTNISSTDAFLTRWCNQASKTHPIVVPLRVLRRHLDDAVDAIGAYSLLNPVWKAEAEKLGLPPPTQLELLRGDPDLELSASYNASLEAELATAARTTPVPV